MEEKKSNINSKLDQQPEETRNKDFQLVLKALVDAYQPILQKDLDLTKDPRQLQEEALKQCERACEEELTFANQIFDKFFTKEVAAALLPEEGRQRFGPISQWEWCYWHIRCCLIFGWLVCRAPRTFRAFVYYLYRYWVCIRFGKQVPERFSAEERKDFELLVGVLAGAYKPYLKDQLASVEFPGALPEEVIAGKIDCLEGQSELGDVFDRLLSVDALKALLGREAFERYSKEPIFWFCRCWCLCSIRFGCCLGHARSIRDLVCCVLDYWRCIRDCFRPLVCGITDPASEACAEASFVSSCSPLAGIHIGGTAAGSSFHHYTLSYSWGGGPTVTDAVVYPNCGRPPAQASSNVPISGGTLGYLDVTLLPPGETAFTIFLDVFDSGAGQILCSQTFKLKTTAVEITAAAKVNAFLAEDPFNPGSFTKLIKATNNPSLTVPELSIGGSFSSDGSAYVVGCDRIMTQFLMSRFNVNPLAPVPVFPSAAGGTPLLATGAVPYDDIPAHPWQSGCFPAITPNIILNGDLVANWASQGCTFLGIPYVVPKVEPVPFFDSIFPFGGGGPLNGRYVLHLEVRDRLLPAGSFPGDLAAVDQVVVWIDNQAPIGQIKSIGGIAGCGDLHLKDFLGTGPTFAEVLGQAWDPPIDSTIPGPPQRPNDNFGGYTLTFQKNGDPLAAGNIVVNIPNRVPNIWPGPLGGAVDVLANWDIATALDGGVGPLPAHSPQLARGDRCAYVVILTVWDATHVGDSGTNHSTGPILYALNIINDIP